MPVSFFVLLRFHHNCVHIACSYSDLYGFAHTVALNITFNFFFELQVFRRWHKIVCSHQQTMIPRKLTAIFRTIKEEEQHFKLHYKWLHCWVHDSYTKLRKYYEVIAFRFVWLTIMKCLLSIWIMVWKMYLVQDRNRGNRMNAWINSLQFHLMCYDDMASCQTICIHVCLEVCAYMFVCMMDHHWWFKFLPTIVITSLNNYPDSASTALHTNIFSTHVKRKSSSRSKLNTEFEFNERERNISDPTNDATSIQQ